MASGLRRHVFVINDAQLNIAESILALRIKSLDDALGKAIQQMLTMHLKFAVLVWVLPSPN